MNSLSGENQLQLQKYLRFFRQKRDALQRSVAEEFRDAKNDRSDEDVFTREDFMDFIDSLSGKVKSNVSYELSSIVNMGALVISQLLESAELKGVELELDISSVEDQSMLEAVDQMSLTGVVSNKARGGGLVPFKEEAKRREGEAKAMRDEADRLESSNRAMSDRFTQAQADATRLLREKNALAQEVAELKMRLDRAERTAADSRSSARRSDDPSARVRELEDQLEEAREEVNRKVQDTTQFRQMKTLMQSQSSKIRDLRYRLQRYEPDDAGKEDDDA